MTRKISLQVNASPISLDYFVAGFVDHTTAGMIEALENTGPIQTLTLSINGDKVDINLNGKPVPVNQFATKMLRSTMLGMVAPLKGVAGPVNQLKLEVAR
jgi:hypothetical protein